MAGRPGPGDKTSGSEGAWIAALLLAAVAIWLIWTFARGPIVYVSFALDWAQIKLIELISGLGPTGADYLNFVEATFDGRLDANTVTFDELVLTSKTVGGQLRFVLSGLLAAMAAVVIFTLKAHRFRRSFTLSGCGGPSFIHYHSLPWQVIVKLGRASGWVRVF